MRTEFRFTRWQVTLIRCLMPPSALLSVLGSCLICRRLLERWKKSRTVGRSEELWACYERLMFGLSAADIMTSTSLIVVSIFFRPHHEPSAVCTVEGFLLTLGISGPLYNAAISLYFLITICSSRKEKRIGWQTECILHLIAVGFPLVSALVGVLLQVFNPETTDIGCWATEHPAGCTGDNCIRGARAEMYGLFVALLLFSLIFLFLIGSNAAIYWHVRRLVLKTLRFTNPAAEEAPATVVTNPSSGDFDVQEQRGTSQMEQQCEPSQPEQQRGSQQEESALFRGANKRPNQSVSKIRMVATQSTLYVGAFMICFIWTYILVVVEIVDPEGFQSRKYFFFNVLQALFYPSQGFFNAFVFCRPNYMRIRATAAGQELSRWQCMKLAMFPPPQR
jgi:hypothetical protein